jgi:hypothetical protein
MLFWGVVVPSLASLFTVAPLDVFLDDARGWKICKIAGFSEPFHGHDVVKAYPREVHQAEWPPGMPGSKDAGLVDVLHGGDAHLQHPEGFTGDDPENPVEKEPLYLVAPL